MKKYLLPCTCGQKNEVDSNQSGLTIKCACGAEMEVPTMRGLAQLQVVEGAADSSAAAAPAWGPGQGSMFLGIVLTLGGLVALGMVMTTRPQWKVHSDQIAVHVDKLSVEQLWHHWQDLRKGLNPGEDPIRQEFEQQWATYRRHMTMSIIPLVVGLLMTVGGFLFKRSQPKRGPARG